MSVGPPVRVSVHASARPQTRDRTGASRWISTAGAALIVLAAFAPWVRSGEVTYNSFGTARAAATLDVGAGALTAAWPFVPLLAALILLATVVRRDRVAAIGALVLAVATTVFAVAVLGAPVTHGVGPVIALVAAMIAVGGAVFSLARRTAGP